EILSPVITEQPVSPDTVQAGAGTATFHVIATGQNLTYQWQEFISTWEDISESGLYEGVLSSTLNIVNPPINMNGYKYRCIVSGLCDPPAITDGLASLTVVNTVDVKYIQNKGAINNITINTYPNPFSKKIVLKYFLPLAGDLSIEIIDIEGKSTGTKINRFETEGNHSLKLALYHLKPGIYNAKVQLKNNNKVLSGTIKIVCRK
ncbi:MAG: T9SS type A sorting domain-containing protein, partial [Bacteroidales bacterium]|nr:T9SS type A sorting domain-containing protein [Bacteroidales bacterium]